MIPFDKPGRTKYVPTFLSTRKILTAGTFFIDSYKSEAKRFLSSCCSETVWCRPTSGETGSRINDTLLPGWKEAARGQEVRRNTSFQTDPSTVLSFRFVDATKKVFFVRLQKPAL